MDTEELKRAWNEVPDRAIVMCRKTPTYRGGTWFGYRYGRMGRWIYYHDAWDPGRMYWSWDLVNGNTEGLSDFVVIARDVSPHTVIVEAAVLCAVPKGPPTCTIVSFYRGSRILWSDVAPGMLVMVHGGSVAYKHADGQGQWIREGFEAWGDGGQWTWLEAARHCVQPVCGVLATGVLDVGLVRGACGGLDARVELET